MRARLWIALPLAALAAATPRPAAAQYAWTGGAGNGNWSAPGNWSGGLPVSGTATSITLDGTAQTVTTQNIAASFTLNQLILGPGATAGFVVDGYTTGPGQTLAGQLVFGGADPLVQTTATAPLRVNAPVRFDAATTIDSPVNFTTGAEVILAGPLSGAGSLTRTSTDPGANPGPGMVILSGNNLGFTGSVTADRGLIQLGGNNALFRTTLNTGGVLPTSGFALGTRASAGPGFSNTGSFQQVGRLEGTLGGLDFGTTGTPASGALVGFDGTNSSFGGPLQGTNTLAHFGKVGGGTLTMTGNSGTYNGTASVRDGTILLQGANGRFSSVNAGAITIYGGGTIRLNNATNNQADRLPGNTTTAGTALVLAGGTLELIGNNAAVTQEFIGGLRFASGESLVSITPGTTAGTQVTTSAGNVATGLAQLSPTATVFFRGSNLGLAAVPAAGTAGVNLNDAAGTVGGIIPYAVGSTANTGGPTTLVGFSAATGSLRPLQDADYTTFAAANPTSNVSDGGFAVGTAAAVNALRATGSVTLTGGLTLTAGTLLNTVAGVQITGAGGLSFGPAGAATAFVTAAADLTITTPVAAANFAKSGTGTLTLAGTVTLNGTGERRVAVNNGTLAVAAGGNFASAQPVTFDVSRGATLDVTGAGGLTLTGSRTLRGGGTVAGPVTVGSTGTIIPSAVAGPDATRASPDTLSVGAMAWHGGGAYRVYMNSAAAGRDTISRIAAAGLLDLTDPSLTSANRFTVRLDALALSNADIATRVYDFDETAPYSWTILTAAGGIAGFSADKFTLDTSDFIGLPAGSSFALTQSGNSLVVTFTPVPEPAALVVAAVSLAAGPVVRRIRTSRRREAVRADPGSTAMG